MCFSRSKKNKFAENIPVIALLKNNWNHRQSIIRYKIQDYILIPIIPEEVIHRVEVNLFYYYCIRPYHLNNRRPCINNNKKLHPIKPTTITNEINLTVRTCKYLLDNLSKQQSLDSISKHMGTNRSKLAASFKSTLGVSVFQWLRQQRLIKASILLRKTEASIKNIALEVGYTNFSHFSTAYKAYFNNSPKMERKNTQSKIIITQ